MLIVCFALLSTQHSYSSHAYPHILLTHLHAHTYAYVPTSHTYTHLPQICIHTEDAYRIDAEIDGEVVGLDILDTAGQVRTLDSSG